MDIPKKRPVESHEAMEELDLVAEGFAKLPEAERFLGLSRAKIYALMDGGQLPYAKFGRARRIPWRALKEWAARGLVG
jgi:excisionase family DNA binding protein